MSDNTNEIVSLYYQPLDLADNLTKVAPTTIKDTLSYIINILRNTPHADILGAMLIEHPGDNYSLSITTTNLCPTADIKITILGPFKFTTEGRITPLNEGEPAEKVGYFSNLPDAVEWLICEDNNSPYSDFDTTEYDDCW